MVKKKTNYLPFQLLRKVKETDGKKKSYRNCWKMALLKLI